MSQKRDDARAKATVEREARQAEARKKRLIIQFGIMAGALALVGITIAVLTLPQPAAAAIVSPNNMVTGGFSTTDGTPALGEPIDLSTEPLEVPDVEPGVPRVSVYMDYLCSFCQEFEVNFGPTLTQLAETGGIILEYRPVAILDIARDGYSTRAHNLMSCVADTQPDSFVAVHEKILGAQKTAPFTNDELLDMGREAGLTVTDEIQTCVDDTTFEGWVSAFTAATVQNPSLVNPSTGSFGTPTILINGERFNGTDLLGAIAAASTSTAE